MLILCAGTSAPTDAAEPPPDAPPGGGYQSAVMIRFEGPITPLLEQFLYRKLEVAEKKNADLVIIEIDSPGGFVGASFNVAHRLRDLDWARTVAFVPREALSGAAIVALGCDEIVMNPNAVLGDAGPIVEGEDSMFRHAPEKIRSHLAAEVRALATAKRRPPALAEAMVDMHLPVYPVKHRQTGQETFMSEAEIKSSPNPELWEKGPPVLEAQDGRFLEVNGRRAVELQLAAATVQDRAELQQRFGLADRPLVLEASAVDTAVYILNLPLVTGLLFVVGLVAFYIEFSAPGISLGGLIGLLCFALFFWSRFLGGTAELLQVILFLVGVAFVALEVFVLPGFGVSGVIGGLLMLAAIMMALQGFAIPSTPRQFSVFGTSLLVLTTSLAVFVAAACVLSRYFGALPVFNRLVLKPAPAPEAAATAAKADTGKTVRAVAADGAPGVGDWGVTESPLLPAGKARFGHRLVDVIAEGTFVERGRQVRIVEIRGAEVVVRDVEDT
jgi:membrane-bound serine protease (ClpP class)